MILSVVQKESFYDCLAEPPGFRHGEHQLKKKVKILYAGRIAESFLLKDDITIGAQNDIEKASEIIKSMILRYGMNKNKTMLNLDIIKDEEQIIEEAKLLSEELEKEVFKDLKSNKHILEDIVNALLEKETLYNEDIEEIMNRSYEREEEYEDEIKVAIC